MQNRTIRTDSNPPAIPPSPHVRTELAAPRWEVETIVTVERLEAVASVCRSEPLIAIDTETYGWKADKGPPSPSSVGTLSVCQIGLPEHRYTALIDIAALREQNAGWHAPLKSVLEAPTPLKIVHYGPFERAVFEGCGLPFEAGVIDTCAIAKALWPELQAHYPGLSSRSLKNLAQHILGVEISKAEQKGDWSTRPLSAEQIAYAALDVELTADLYRVLQIFCRVNNIDPTAVEWKTPPSPR